MNRNIKMVLILLALAVFLFSLNMVINWYRGASVGGIQWNLIFAGVFFAISIAIVLFRGNK